MTRQTHTFARLEIPRKAFKEIKAKLTEAGYSHLFVDDNTIDMTGIGISPKPPKPRKPKPRILTGKELRYAADNGLQVHYVEEYHDPHCVGMNYNGVCVMEKAPNGYYIGQSDIQPEFFADDDEVHEVFDEGEFTVYAVDGVNYSVDKPL